MEITVSIEGPVELTNGELTLQIPLSVDGDKLAPLAHGVGRIEGDYRCVIIPDGLAQEMRIGPGSLVIVDDKKTTARTAT